MTEYVAVAVTVLGAMFFTAHVSFSLNEKHDTLRFFLISIAMIMGIGLIHLGMTIAESASMSADVLSAVSYVYWVWIVTTSLFLIYFAVYFVKAGLLFWRDRRELRFTGGER